MNDAAMNQAMLLAQKLREPRQVYGVPSRSKLYPGESDYFRKNPHVTGMAAEDDAVIMNPYSSLSPQEKQAVQMNEAARIHMRKGVVPAPQFQLSPDQSSRLGGYSANPDDVRQTLAARILSGDPSAGQATPEQLDYVKSLKKAMGLP